MPGIQSGCQQAVSRDHWQMKVVLNRDESSFRRGVELSDRYGIGRIDYRQIRGFQDNFRLEVAHFVQFMSDAVERLLPDGDPEGFFTANSNSVRLDLRSAPPFIGKWVERKGSNRWVFHDLGRTAVIFRDQRLSNGNLVHAVLGQGNTNRIADAVGQQRPDSDRALDPPVLPFTGPGPP